MSLFCEARVRGEVEYTLGDKVFYECRPCGAEAVPAMAGYEGPAICVDCLARQLEGSDWLGYYDGNTPPDAPTTDSAAWYAALLDIYREENPGVVAATPGALRAWFNAQLAAAEASEKEAQEADLKREWIKLDEELMSSGASAGNNFGFFFHCIKRKMEIEEELKKLAASC